MAGPELPAVGNACPSVHLAWHELYVVEAFVPAALDDDRNRVC